MNYTEIAEAFERSLSEIPKNWQSILDAMRRKPVPTTRHEGMEDYLWSLVENTLNFHFGLVRDTDQFEHAVGLLEKGN